MLKLYRFTHNGVRFTKSFESDDKALWYGEGMTDTAQLPLIEKLNSGDWFSWEWQKEAFVYNPNAFRGHCPHFRPDGSMCP